MRLSASGRRKPADDLNERTVPPMASPRKKALVLEFFTVGYNILEGVVSILAAVAAGSTALLGFGLDSFVESLSGSIIIWRFWKYGPETDEDEVAEVEQKATRLVAYTLFILGAYVTLDAGKALYTRQKPDARLVGIVIALVSIVVMPVLFFLKYRLGKSIGSSSLVADSKETLACSLLSVALLVGLGANYLWNLWWVDPAAALVIAFLIFREGNEVFWESRETD